MTAGTFRALPITLFQQGYSEQYWYAPAVRWWVKIDTSRNWHAELVSYTLAPPPTRR